MDPEKRISADEALRHSWFIPLLAKQELDQMEESLPPQANRPSLPESVSDQYISI